MYKLGIDAGSYSVSVAVLDSENGILYEASAPHKKKVKEEAVRLLEEAYSKLRMEEAYVSVTGSMSHLLNMKKEAFLSSVPAITRAWNQYEKNASSMILIGAQKTMYLSKPDGIHFEVRKNSNCSSGTGAFFEEQSSRLKISLNDISEMVKNAKTIPNIAGRCSVFSKTDMIHHMQEGVPTEDILLGLCYALVRNYKSSILKNERPTPPVLLTGGVMENEGVIRALKELLDLKDSDIIRDSHFKSMASLGAAMEADQIGSSYSLSSLRNEILRNTMVESESLLKPLSSFTQDSDAPVFDTVSYNDEEEAYLGIDVGSTSINLVLLNSREEVIYYSYVKTLGRPLDVVRNEILKLKNEIPNLRNFRISITGSGREYIGKQIGADLCINEITAQTEGTLRHLPDTDTIFEIGGQDSKYMSITDGKMTDFEMNKVCAAGTGAFLEEQIHKLGISLKEFSTLALKSTHPAMLGNRCTVFIEGSVNQALSVGYSLEDVCAGLAYAIASNYLFRVVNRKRIGNQIAIQGGIAYNQAVICAFRSITGKKITVSPYFSVTGALGAACLLIHSHHLVFDGKKNRKLNEILLKKSEESYLMDYHKPEGRKKVVGIPRVVFLHKMFPLFNGLFSNLGYDVLLSPLSDSSIIEYAQKYATAETCYPIKLIYGHIAWLLKEHVDVIVLPRLYTIKHEGSVARKDYACMYMQTSPLLMEEAFHFKERGVKLIMPELSIEFGRKYMLNSILSIGPEIGVPKARMLPAAISGFSKLVSHGERLEAIGRESLEGDEPIFVLISRVYNILDPVLNMGIEEHLNSIGCRVIHLEHLQASVMHVEHDYPGLYWPFGQHILTGLKLVKAHKNMYPIYITNHGCGPDTAIQHFFQNEMEGREYLHLEVDEHTSKVGIITRLEAFLYSLHPQEAVGEDKIVYGSGGCDGCTSCSDASVVPPLSHFGAVLIPEYGIYSDILEKYVRKEIMLYADEGIPDVVRVKPLTIHKTFDYAMNKEYHTMLIMLEELLNTVRRGIPYVMVAPVDEGSEVFGQYALLCTQELKRRGYNVVLRPFYLEDIIKREDHKEIYKDMLESEMKENELSMSDSKRYYVMGEPMAVCKTYIRKRNLKAIEDMNMTFMPFSEVLYFHMTEIDRKHEYKKELSEWEILREEAFKTTSGKALYTPMKKLQDNAEGRLDFLIGDAGKYRFAKLLSIKKKDADAVILLNSSEENTAIILNQLQSSYRSLMEVPYAEIDIDYDHEASKEDFELL